MKRGWLLAAVLLASGCAYYNGLYNANRLAKEAERAERDGRTGEARSLWSQAAVKAESVVSRHPKSRHHDDALYLQGRALERIGSCTQAIPPLRLAADSSPETGLRVRSRLLLGDCRLQLGEPESTLVAVRPVLDEGGPAARSAALLLRGRALLRLGRNEEALEQLSAAGVREGNYARAIALARLGRHAEATATLAAIVDGPYAEQLWLPTLDSVGAGHPAAVVDLVDRLAVHPEVRVGQRARLWLGDGVRWLSISDSGTADSRFSALRETVPDSAEGRSARAYLAAFAAVRAIQWDDVPALADSLRAAIQMGGNAARIASAQSGILGRARDHLEPGGTPLGLFLAAEHVRDSVRNRALAAALFEQVVERYGESVLAPKALLAIAALRPEGADSVVGLMRDRYPDSPYTMILAGVGSAAFEALEDSLRREAAAGGRRVRDETDAVRRRADSARRVRSDR